MYNIRWIYYILFGTLILYTRFCLMHDLNRKQTELLDPESSELERFKKEQVYMYLEKHDTNKDNWIDPYDMLNYKENDLSSENPQKTIVFKTKYSDYPDLEHGHCIKDNIFTEKTNAFSLNSESNICISKYKYDEMLNQMKHNPDITIDVYVKRWLKKLILKCEQHFSLEPYAIQFLLKSENLEEIKKMSSNLKFNMLDEIFEQMIDDSIVVSENNYLIPKINVSLNEILMGIILFIIILMIAYLYYNYPFSTFIMFLACIFIAWQWKHMYYQHVSKKHAQLKSFDIPSHCISNNRGLYEDFILFIKTIFITDDKCEKYYEALMVPAIWEVNPLNAIAETIASFICQPILTLSTTINESAKRLYDGLSLFACIFVTIFVLILFIMLCNYRIKLPFFMGVIEPVYPNPSNRIEHVPPNSQERSFIKSTLYYIGKISSVIYLFGTQRYMICEESSNSFTTEDDQRERVNQSNSPGNESSSTKISDKTDIISQENKNATREIYKVNQSNSPGNESSSTKISDKTDIISQENENATCEIYKVNQSNSPGNESSSTKISDQMDIISKETRMQHVKL